MTIQDFNTLEIAYPYWWNRRRGFRTFDSTARTKCSWLCEETLHLLEENFCFSGQSFCKFAEEGEGPKRRTREGGVNGSW
jgi:hypothetical protein